MEQKGICRLGIVAVRREPHDTAEMVTQLLFGDHYRMLETSQDRKWHKIQVEFDGYEGWIDAKQHYEISDDYFEYLNQIEFKICTDLTSEILYQKNLVHIVIGSVLPISSSELFDVHEHLAFNGEAKNLGEKRDYEFLKNTARKYLQSPYLWGGKSPFGIDCSGFVQQVFRICGYRLKRDAVQQFLQGVAVEFSSLKPGDLAFFRNDKHDITHVGIVLEENKIIHASGWVRVDFLDEHGIFNENIKAHTHQLAGLRRILKT